MQLPRRQGRIGAKLAAEPLPEVLVRGQGFGLLARLDRGRHVPAMSRLVERVGGHGRFRVTRRPPRVPGRQRRLGRDQADPAQQLAHLLAGRIRPVRVRLVADRRARGQQLMRALGRGQRHCGGGGQLAFGLIAEAGRRVQVDDDARPGGQPVSGPAALDEVGSQRRAEPADQGRDVLLRRDRPFTRPQDVHDPVQRDQARPFDREQLEQYPRLPAADLSVGQFDAVPDDPERTRETQFNETQLYLCSADRSRGNRPPHVHFLTPGQHAVQAMAGTEPPAVSRCEPGPGGRDRNARRTRARSRSAR